MDLKKNITTNQNNNQYSNAQTVTEQNQIKTSKNIRKRNTNTIKTKDYNNFMGVFGVHPNDAKYMKKKKIQKKKIVKLQKKKNQKIKK